MNHGSDTIGPDLVGRVRGLLPQLAAELIDRVAIPSVSEPGFAAAREAWSAAWSAETMTIGAGGSIRMVSSRQQAVPNGDILTVGTTDGFATIHGPNERVLLDEFEKARLAKADLSGRLAIASGGGKH